MIPLIGKNIKLRAVEPSDLDVLFEWENDPENWTVSNTSAPFSRHVLQKYIETAQLDIYESRQLRLMIDRLDPTENEPETIGIIDLFDFDPQHLRAGVGILIARKEDRMKGLASEALSLLIEYGFGTLHLHQLFCNVTEDNLASIKLFEKHGFLRIGNKKDWIRSENEWINVLLLQLINSQND
ncbi:GNAT family N-acetyltransferase [Bacteroidota bacterium]